MQTPAHPPAHSSVCGDLPPSLAMGGPKATSYGSSFTLVCSWPTPHPLPSLSLQLCHSASSITYSDLLFLALCFLASMPQGFLGKQHLGHLLPSEGPLGKPCLPSMRDSHSCSTLFEVRGRALPSHSWRGSVWWVAGPWPLGWVRLGLLGVIVVLFGLKVLGFWLCRTPSPRSAPSI